MKKKFCLKVICWALVWVLSSSMSYAEEDVFGKIEDYIGEIQNEIKSPGLSVIIVKGDGSQYMKGFGYADLAAETKVSPETKFELGSCSKSFTALAALQLEERGLIDLDDPVSNYFPGFFVMYKKQKHDITIRQLLHHTSGIPAHSLALFSKDSSEDALRDTVQKLVGIEVETLPGEGFQYATINYDVVGALIEKVSGKTFEEYMSEYIFKPLGLTHTSVGVNPGLSGMAKGYKIGFFAPREYSPPIYRGNNPAAYIISNGEDMARWLKIQMGLIETGMSRLINKSHIPDQMVLPNTNLEFYQMGWWISRHKKNEIRHAGLNPNFTSYVGFRPGAKIGVVLLSNSNTSYTAAVGNRILQMMSNENVEELKPAENKIDAICSIFSVILGVIILAMLIYLIFKVRGIAYRKKKYEPITWKKFAGMVILLIACLPLYIGFYIFPAAIMKLSWETFIVWGPVSISILLKSFIAFFILSYIIYCLSLLFPDRNVYRNIIPLVLTLNTVSSLAGMVILPIFMGSFFSQISIGYILYYFGLALAINVVLSKVARTKMIYFSNDITLDIRVDLIKKILSTRYQQFEKLLDGRIITTVSTDVVAVTEAVGLFMELIANSVVVIAGIVYLSTISLTASVVVVLSAVALAIYYIYVSARAKVFLEEARTAQNIAVSLLNGLINGFKELSMHLKKKKEFKEDLVESCVKIRETNIVAGIKFLNSEIISGTLGTIVIGLFCILVPRLLTNVNVFVLISLIVVVLYLRGPISALIGILPRFTGIRVSWGRIKKFNEDIDPTEGAYSFKKFFMEIDRPDKKVITIEKELPAARYKVENIKVEGVGFKYKDAGEGEGFEVGPIDFEVNRGEILFITGGNGSGKTTLLKILAGLYAPDKGAIKINGDGIDTGVLGECSSAIFSDYHLFRKLYEIDVKDKDSEIKEYLKLLHLEDKVYLDGDSFSTIDVSGGQRKRLALIQCYLEGRSFFLFDELAANQDPGFRHFIYRVLFRQMKEEGKIVIACTHDDHYFDAADKIIKMDMGKIDEEFTAAEVSVQSISEHFIKKYD